MFQISKKLQSSRDAERTVARQEWSRLCYVLEGLQATALLQRNVDKHTIA